MILSKYKISNLKKIKSRSKYTDFQESISDNNKELFFAYIEQIKDKLDLNQETLSGYTLIQLAYRISKYKKDDTIFNFLYSHPNVDITKKNKNGTTLLNLAAENKNIEDFKKFEKDGIYSQHIIYSYFFNLPILRDNIDFSLLKYILKNKNYKIEEDDNKTNWWFSSLIDYYYRNNRPEDIKEIFFKLQERNGSFFDNSYQSNKLLLLQTISKNDVSFFEEILRNKIFQTKFKQLCIEGEDRLLNSVIKNYSYNPDFLNLYKEIILPIRKTKNYHFNDDFFQKNKKTDQTLEVFKFLIKEIKVSPFKEQNRCIITDIFNYSDNVMPFLKFLESESFDLQQIFTFSSIKKSLLEYAYCSGSKDKKEVIEYLTNNINYNIDNIKNFNQSPIFLSLKFKDEKLYEKSLPHINLFYNNEHILSHILKYKYNNQNDYSIILGKNKNIIQFFEYLIDQTSSDDIIKYKDSIIESLRKFENNYDKSNLGFLKNNFEEFYQKINIILEKKILNNVIKNNKNSNKPTKRL